MYGNSMPAGFQQQFDAASGRPYYVNTMTGETSWTPPAGAQSAAPPPAAPAAPPPSGGLPPGWEERTDPASGRKFYIDHVNKTTSWELPRESAAAPSYAAAPRQATAQVDRDAELARELAEQWDREEAEDRGRDDDDDDSRQSKKEWASDADTTNCFLTDVKFSLVQRKHHCRYCGQIFVSDVCKKTTRIPSIGFDEPVRVCDICFDQIERGDPVCVSKQVALLRSSSESSWQQGAKALGDWAAMDPQFAHQGIVHALDVLKVPELLPHLLDGTSSATQGAVAKLLAAILQYEEYRELLSRVDLFEPLLSALKSSSTETKAAAAGARVDRAHRRRPPHSGSAARPGRRCAAAARRPRGGSAFAAHAAEVARRGACVAPRRSAPCRRSARSRSPSRGATSCAARAGWSR